MLMTFLKYIYIYMLLLLFLSSAGSYSFSCIYCADLRTVSPFYLKDILGVPYSDCFVGELLLIHSVLLKLLFH
jgi:hypothetical protein